MSTPNILLVTKGHPFDHNASFFVSLDVDWTHVEQPAARVFFSPELAADYDALVMYDMPGINLFAREGPGHPQRIVRIQSDGVTPRPRSAIKPMAG